MSLISFLSNAKGVNISLISTGAYVSLSALVFPVTISHCLRKLNYMLRVRRVNVRIRPSGL